MDEREGFISSRLFFLVPRYFMWVTNRSGFSLGAKSVHRYFSSLEMIDPQFGSPPSRWEGQGEGDVYPSSF